MGLFGFDDKEEILNKALEDFKIYTYEYKFEEDIVDTKFVLEGGINMFDAIDSVIKTCKKNGFHSIIGAGIGGGNGMYFYGTAVKLKK